MAYQPKSSKPIRYLVRHFHEAADSGRSEEVIISYNTTYPRAFECAVSTASRYNGVIYADYGDKTYEFVRSYVGRRDEEEERAVSVPSSEQETQSVASSGV